MDNEQDILKKANVLVISDDPTELAAVKKRGFERVDYFKSEICAAKYFSRNKRRLATYDLVIFGHLETYSLVKRKDCNMNELLDRVFRRSRKPYVCMEQRPTYDSHEWKVRIHDSLLFRELQLSSTKCEDALEKCLLALKDVEHKYKFLNRRKPEFVPVTIKYPIMDTYPTTKKDLKILFCHPGISEEIIRKLETLYKVKIEIVDENTTPFAETVTRLGDYDLIIGTNRRLKRVLAESREQCNMTGRALSLIAVFEDSVLYCDLDKDTSTSLTCIESSVQCFASGRVCRNASTEAIEEHFKIPIIYNLEDTPQDRFTKRDEKILRAHLETSLILYTEQIKTLHYDDLYSIYWEIRIGKKVRSPQAYNTLYELTHDRVAKEIETEIAPLEKLNEIRKYIATYIKYRQEGTAFTNLKDIRLSRPSETYRIEIVHKGRALCSLTLQGSDSSVYQVISTQSLGMKGRLNPARTSIIAIKKYGLALNQYNQASKEDICIIDFVHKKVMSTIKPIVEQASVNYPQRGKRISMTPTSGRK